MADFPYYGTYARFDTLEKKDGATLMNADSIVGDRYEIEIARENGARRAWLKNRFGARVGFFDEATTHELSLCEAKGWTLVGILSFAAFSEMPEPGVYWGQAAIIAYDELHADVVEPFYRACARAHWAGRAPAGFIRPRRFGAASGGARLMDANRARRSSCAGERHRHPKVATESI